MIYTGNYREHLFVSPLLEDDIERVFDKNHFYYDKTYELPQHIRVHYWGLTDKNDPEKWRNKRTKELSDDIGTYNNLLKTDYFGALNQVYNSSKKYGDAFKKEYGKMVFDNNPDLFVYEDKEKNANIVADHLNEIISQAKTAPKSWIGKKIKSLRNLYLHWLHKKQLNNKLGKGGFIDKILEMIGNAIDWLLRKLQNFSG